MPRGEEKGMSHRGTKMDPDNSQTQDQPILVIRDANQVIGASKMREIITPTPTSRRR